MAAILKRVSQPTEQAISELAQREGRTFVAQLDRVVDAGLVALGQDPVNGTEPPAPTPQPKGRKRATAGR